MASVQEGSAHELAFSMLLSLALVPDAQRLVADRNEVQCIVKVLTRSSVPSTRLEAMLVLGRLAARCVAVQQDAVREGAVPVLVGMMQQGTDEERCHASRLLALLGQHASTHQIILQADALPVVMRMVRDRGHRAPPGLQLQPGPAPDGRPLHVWQAAHAAFNAALAEGASSQAASTAAAMAAAAAGKSDDGSSSSSTLLEEQHQQQQQLGAAHTSPAGSRASSGSSERIAAATAAATSSVSVGPGLVLEQAVGVVCMLVHNPDNHFAMVGEGLVPLMVSLLHRETPGKTMTYALASLLMLAIAEPRHAAVVARTGAVPLLVLVAREGSNRPVNRELSAALLAVLCRSQDVQVDVVAAGGIPALARLMVEGSDGARCYACEALAQVAAGAGVRCRLVAGAGALAPLRSMLQPGGGSLGALWAARLLKVLVQVRVRTRLGAGMSTPSCCVCQLCLCACC
ncbi:armadillo-type protein [Scenedesmus sp. NREL 46B-D3]|nr:armadillo-type protein [Scenedesmus sp. NREL 46B-D3]